MALRAFQHNPSLGGFGNESGEAASAESILESRPSTSNRSSARTADAARKGDTCEGILQNGCDAFAQIIKELVDNAVDACKGKSLKSQTRDDYWKRNYLKRVRVNIETFGHDTKSFLVKGNGKDDDSRFDKRELLLVTVNDNGCGMEDVEKCVSAFSTSKSSPPESGTNKVSNTTDAVQAKQNQSRTAGRYGVGLTLAFLHAQRLVPNTCASIVSATAETSFWTSATFVVDTEKDSVDCVKKNKTTKQTNESGTSIRLLVPVSNIHYFDIAPYHPTQNIPLFRIPQNEREEKRQNKHGLG